MVETPRHALVVEGGGMRGSYAAGAVGRLLFDEGRRYDAIWATSSGAATCAYAVAGQRDGLSIWQDHLHGRRLVKPLRLLTGQDALDLDYLIDTVFRHRVPLDLDALGDAGVPIHVPATDVADGSLRYFDLTRRDPFPVLRAAMSLPGAVTQATHIDDGAYVDGGVVDQMPIHRALDAGADEVTVVLTRPLGHKPKPTGPIGAWLATRPFPGLRQALRDRHRRYARQLRTVAEPPAGVTVHAVHPPRELRIRRWTTSRRRILAAIDQGWHDAQATLDPRPRPTPGS